MKFLSILTIIMVMALQTFAQSENPVEEWCEVCQIKKGREKFEFFRVKVRFHDFFLQKMTIYREIVLFFFPLI